MSKKHDGKKTVTVWASPKTELVSQYGVVTYETWCEHEVARMKSHGDDVEVKHELDEVCVSR